MKKTRYTPMKTYWQIFLLIAIIALNMGPIGSSTVHAAAPGNDDLINAMSVTIGDTITVNNVEEATIQTNEKAPTQACDGGTLALGWNSIWFSYSPASTGYVSFDTVGSLINGVELDTYIAVWTGDKNDIDSLTMVGCDDNNDIGFTSQFAFEAQSGTTYYIQVAKWQCRTDIPCVPDDPCTTEACSIEFNVKNQSFTDVPPTHPYFEYIEVLYANGYTNGCSATPLKYCPDGIMNRAQVAKFFMTVEYGATYLPPADTPLLFTDSWKINPWAKLWANDMYDKGLTSGCRLSPLRYCPDNQVIREQVAKFGLAIKYGSAYEPPTATGTVFADLTDPDYWATAWAEQAYADGLVPACGTDIPSGKPLFCPYGKVDRGFAAFVIVTATGLLGP